MPYTATYRITQFISREDVPGHEMAVEVLLHRTPEGCTVTVKPTTRPELMFTESADRHESALLDRMLSRLGDLHATADRATGSG